MTNSDDTGQLRSLRSVVFGAVESWNVANPHPLRSRHERASVNVTQTFADASGLATYSITVSCKLSGSEQLTFHGPNLAAVAEHAQLTLERKITAELQRRAQKGQFDRNYDLAV